MHGYLASAARVKYPAALQRYKLETPLLAAGSLIKMQGKNAGKAMDYSDVENLFRKLRKKMDIYITPHMFRHTSLSMLNAAGWEPELLRVRAGHKNIYTMLNTYVHPSDAEVSEAFQKVSENLKMPGREVSE